MNRKINISQLSEELQKGLAELAGVLNFTAAPEGLVLRAVQTKPVEPIEKTELDEQVGRSSRSGQTDWIEQSSQTGQTERVGQSSQAGQVDWIEQSSQTERIGQSSQTERNGEVTICYDGSDCVVGYAKRPQFFKAFAHILRDEGTDAVLTPAFKDLEAMVDCSRNAVLSVAGAKKLIRYLAVMGFDGLQLYTEDTLAIPEYPYAGYMRGRYSREEIVEIRDYAALFGIELIPCIQTLAHLGQTLRWGAHAEMWDIDNILLIDEEKSYDFIESLVRECRAMFTSDRINIGMDEAYQVGMGKYLKKHGYTDRSALMVKHLNRVVEICRKYGFKAMMWSDMFFYLQFQGDYYVDGGSFSDAVKKAIPPELTLVYWDYYSRDKERYRKMFGMHQELHGSIAFAGGAWRWTGAVPNNGFSLLATEAALTEAIGAGIPRAIATLWGDDGGEASVFSVLPTLQLYSDLNFYGHKEDLKENFAVTAGMAFDDFMLVDGPQDLPAYDFSEPWTNPPKYMLFQDVLMGIFDLHVKEEADAEHFRQTGERISRLLAEMSADSPWGSMFRATEALCEVLRSKCDMGVRVRKLYEAGDKAGLLEVAEEEIPMLQEDIRHYYECFKQVWMESNKVFGLEIQDIRYGGLLMRLKSVAERLTDYAEGRISQIPELEQELLPYSGPGEIAASGYVSEAFWRKIVSASPVSGV